MCYNVCVIRFIPFCAQYFFLLLQSPNFLTDFIRLYIIKPLLCPIIAFFWIFCLILLSLRDGNSHGQRHHVLDCLSYSGQLNISGKPLGQFLQMFTQIWTQEWTSLESVSKMSTVKIIVTSRPSYSYLRNAWGGRISLWTEMNPVAGIELEVIDASPCGKALCQSSVHRCKNSLSVKTACIYLFIKLLQSSLHHLYYMRQTWT